MSSSTPSPYRNEVDALRERKETLEREIARLAQQTSELEGLRVQQQRLERELSAVSHRLGASARRTLPLLDNLAVASPCGANWDEMVGDERVRFCLSCEKNVYNVSAMASEEAERLLAQSANAGGEICVRFYKRADGTIMTQDCPVGEKKKRRKKVALAVAGAGAMAFAAAAAFAQRQTCTTTMGAIAAPTADPVTPPEPSDSTMGDRAEPTPPHIMGSPLPVPVAPPVKPLTDPKPVHGTGTSPRPPMMGRRAR